MCPVIRSGSITKLVVILSLVTALIESGMTFRSVASTHRYHMKRQANSNSNSSLNKPAVAGTNLMLANKQPTPKYTYAVWDEEGMVCILAKFEAHLTITYDTRNGQQKLTEKIPGDAIAKGRCDDDLMDQKLVLGVSWIGGFTFRVIFEKLDDNEKWGVHEVDLLYNTADSLFRGSVKGDKKVARSTSRTVTLFNAPMGKSYLCPSPPIVNLYEQKTGKPTVVVRFTHLQLQAFEFDMGKFGPASRCSQVSFGSGVQSPLYLSLEQDDSVPVVVGTLTVIVSILVIVGYAVYKSWVFKQVDYDNMI